MHRNLWIEVDKVLWIRSMDFSRLKPEKSSGWWLAIGGRDPPCRRLGGGDCGGTKHLQKKFFKKSFALVDIKRKNRSQFNFHQLKP